MGWGKQRVVCSEGSSQHASDITTEIGGGGGGGGDGGGGDGGGDGGCVKCWRW